LRAAQLHRRQRRDAPLAPLASAARVERQLRQHGHHLGRAVRHAVFARGAPGRRARAARSRVSQVLPASDARAVLPLARMHGLLLRASMRAYEALYWRPLERAARDPDRAQQRVLERLLMANRDTRFGVEHGFAGIRGAEQFRERVPVLDYERLRPYIDEQRRT